MKIPKLYMQLFLILSLLLKPLGVLGAAYPKRNHVDKNPEEKTYEENKEDDHYKYKDPTAKTQINEQTTLFETSTEDWSALQADLNKQRTDASTLTESSGDLLEFMDEGGMAKINGEKEALSSISATELEKKGTDELDKSHLTSELYIDYSIDPNKEHMDFAKKVAAGQNELLFKALSGELKKFDVDCKTVKGEGVVEPAYYLQIEKSEHKDVRYNKTFCEELRNRYSCQDTVTITCLQRNWKYFEWKSDMKSINIDGGHAYGSGWLYSIYWKKKRFGMHMRGDIHEALKNHIAHHTGKNAGQIGDLNISARGEGDISQCAEKEYRWASYKISYRYRDAEEICDQWSEPKWDERCIQKIR